MSDRDVTVVVVDDHPLFRRGVVDFLNDSNGIKVIAEYENGVELLQHWPIQDTDILLLDMQMPEKSGLEVLSSVRHLDQDIKIVIITADNDQENLLEAIRLGANGYLAKDAAPEDILEHLFQAYKGQVALGSDAITSIASHLREHHEEAITTTSSTLANLTERERETLYYIADGLNNKLIARKLGISDGTVKVYVKSLLRKLDMHSRLELAAWAHKNISEGELV